ncbi:hypothetical protein V5799_029737 [Amblyomma americanum]|uniref:SH2 domain-containing protein n=1 Tax=Amblyomma americanum TaxID=6943 RepID=A0AAQ4EQ80_AMBAM
MTCAGVKMLQQILRDMYIDPQLLAELDDEQKHILFCKMREEQVRRWEQREKELAFNNKKNGTTSNSSKPGSKRVDFLLGSDGKPWTWVMGEHPEDSSIEEILERETKEKARIQAAQEALQLRKLEEQQQKQQQQERLQQQKQQQLQEQKQQQQLLQQQQLQQQQLQQWQQQQQQQQEQQQQEQQLQQQQEQQLQQQQEQQLQQQEQLQQQQKEIVVVPATPSPPPEIPTDGIEEVVRLRRKKPLEGCFSLEREVAALLQDSVATSRVATVDRNTWLSQKQQEIRNREESLKQLMEQRSQEIYQEIKAQQRKSIEAAERESMVQEELWIEQEKKAKEVEKQIREIARIAREEHKRALHLTNGNMGTPVTGRDAVGMVSPNSKPPVPPKVVPPPLPSTPPPNLVINGGSNGSVKNGMSVTTTTATTVTTGMPSHATSRSKDAELFSRADIVQWFLREEYPQGAVTDHNGNNPAIWFHGFIGRAESEQLLQKQGGAAAGAFLVRVHERIKGYVISYWAGDRCKHYLIDASLGHCQFFGSNQLVFPRLRDLIWHHTTNPITALGQEQLLTPCPRSNSSTLFSLLPTLGQ